MHRRSVTKLLIAGGVSPWATFVAGQAHSAVTVDSLPKLEGELTLYLGRGEGGLYENVLKAISDRNPDFKLNIRRGPTAALANAIVAESRAGIRRADIFWAVDTGAIGLIVDQELARSLPADLTAQVRADFRYENWLPVTGRVRTIPFNTKNITADQISSEIMSLAETDLRIGWAPEYASFQSFITAMRLLEGEQATKSWLNKINTKAKKYAGELGVVMGVERGEVDIGFANHYYTLRLKAGKPDARINLAFTDGDAGCLVNASGILAINDSNTATDFIRYLFTKEVQTYLATEAFEIPLIDGVASPPGLPSLGELSPPELDLTKLADLRPTLDLMREIRVL